MARPSPQPSRHVGAVRQMSGHSRRYGHGTSSVVLVIVVLLLLAGCSGGSGVKELEHDSADDTIQGPLPTAPPSTDYDGPGLSSEATQLLSRLRDLESEQNLCTVVTSSVIQDLLQGDVDLSGLATTPAGIAQMLVSLDRFFEHIVKVSPPELAPSTELIQRTWRQVAEIGGDVSDRDERVRAIVEAPDTRLAMDNFAAWIRQNCSGAVMGELDLGGLLGL